MSFKPDFTIKTYLLLLDAIREAGYQVLTFKEFIQNQNDSREPFIILRHDVDKRTRNSLRIAKLEAEKGVHSSYYFKFTKLEKDITMIREIASLGHEIGYHYQELVLSRGNYEKAIDLFRKNLEEMRKSADIKTICMDGNPLSKYDNRDLWKKYNYRDFGILAEPYLDTDYSNILYLTDTGRTWNGNSFNVRDKVKSGIGMEFNSTFDIINSIGKNNFPNSAMFNIHPERWNDSSIAWMEEWVLQNLKNLIKKAFFVK